MPQTFEFCRAPGAIEGSVRLGLAIVCSPGSGSVWWNVHFDVLVAMFDKFSLRRGEQDGVVLGLALGKSDMITCKVDL